MSSKKFIFSLKFLFTISSLACLFTFVAFKVHFLLKELSASKKEYFAINKSFSMFTRIDGKSAIDYLSSFKPPKEFQNEVQKMLSFYKKHEKMKQELLKRYKIFENSENWVCAYKTLEELNFHTPSQRTKEREEFLKKKFYQIKNIIDLEKLKRDPNSLVFGFYLNHYEKKTSVRIFYREGPEASIKYLFDRGIEEDLLVQKFKNYKKKKRKIIAEYKRRKGKEDWKTALEVLKKLDFHIPFFHQEERKAFLEKEMKLILGKI